MESAPDLDTVFKALDTLYRDANVSGKEEASTWLGKLQNSVYAWQVADQLLQINKDIESCYFAAQTMRSKIQYAFAELPESAHESLRDSLLNHAAKISADTPPVIATQLSLALADLALQMVSWTGATVTLLHRFGSDVKHLHFLVEFLIVLPEEINSHVLRMGANRRDEVTSELRDAATLMLQLLTACVENCSADERLQAKVFRSLASWLKIEVLPQAEVANNVVLKAAFQALRNPDCSAHLHESASDCVIAGLYISEDVVRHANLAQALFEGVYQLPDLYHISVAKEDMDKSINYCRIFTEMAESYLDVLVSTPGQGFGDLRTLELLLVCCDHHQYEVADITFNFWYCLSEILYQRNSEELTNIFRPYIERLILALCRHCQMDPDHEGVPNKRDEFGDFRQRVYELIRDVIFIVGSTPCFAQMFQHLKSGDATWDVSEASLFVMCSMAKNLLPDENMVVPEVLESVLRLPDTTHIALLYTGIELLGELSEWISHHPQYIESVLQMLTVAMQRADLASVSACSIQYMCCHCQNHLVDKFSMLLQIVEAMDNMNVNKDASVGLLKGAALVLSRMPTANVTQGLQQLCALQTRPLKKVLESGGVKGEVKVDPVMWLDRLASVFRHMNPDISMDQTHPCETVIQEVWPVLSQTCELYQQDVRIIERCCRCVRFVIRCLGTRSASLLSPLVTQIVSIYSTHQHSCFLYLGSVLVDVYGDDAGCTDGLITMLQAFWPTTKSILGAQDGLASHPDIVDDLFRLCTRFLQKCPVPFLQCSSISELLQCAITATTLTHREANPSVTKFLTEFTRTCAAKDNNKENMNVTQQLSQALMQQHGAMLVSMLLNAAIYHLPTSMIYDTAEVIYEIKVVNPQMFNVWFEAALQALPKKSATGATHVTTEQLQEFHSTLMRADSEKKLYRALCTFTRLYR